MSDQQQAHTPLLDRATEVFGSQGKARRRLQREHPALDEAKPAEAARTNKGRAEIERLLGQLEAGIDE